jgi:hypothetical protein
MRSLPPKGCTALGSRPPVIRRADLGDKGVYYRTMVDLFGSTEEAAQFCDNQVVRRPLTVPSHDHVGFVGGDSLDHRTDRSSQAGLGACCC